MSAFPDKEIEELNDLLWKTLGPEGEDILKVKEKDSLELLKNLNKEIYLKLYKILNFYYPRLVASILIAELKGYRYNEFAANNELIIGLTSIIDWLANPNHEKHGWTRRFIEFLENHLNNKEIKSLIRRFVKDKKGKLKKLESIKELAEYIYNIRSLVVHNAELGGMWPYNISFNLSSANMKISNVCYVIEPRVFRKLLWKAITKSVGIDVVSNS